MLEDKSIYMIFEYAEHDFLVSHPHPSTDPGPYRNALCLP